MRTETVIEISQAHIDSLGHLNHVEAVRFLEAAREDWYRACGLYDSDEGERRFAAVVANVTYDYRKECFLGERVSAWTRPISMGRKSFTLGHEIVRPNDEIAIVGEATSVIMDLTERVTIPVPDCMARHLPARP